jgi:hypothetical protein
MKYSCRWSGNFRMPMRMMRWLEVQLAGEQYKLEAIAIAVYVARVWASPRNLGREFALSRPEICKTLDLKDWAVKQSLILLAKIRFLDRLTNYDGGNRQKARQTSKGLRHPPHIYALCARIKAYFLTLLLRRNTPPEYKASPEKIDSSKKPNSEPSGGYILVETPVLPALNDPESPHGWR